jgi:hypothetical protein
MGRELVSTWWVSVKGLTPTPPSGPLKPSTGAAVRDHRNAVRDRSESLSAIDRNHRPHSPESAAVGETWPNPNSACSRRSVWIAASPTSKSSTDGGIRLVERFADCFIDRRRPELVEHRVATLVGQRVFGIALGYEDINDHDELRHDPIMACSPASWRRSARAARQWPASRRSTVSRLALRTDVRLARERKDERWAGSDAQQWPFDDPAPLPGETGHQPHSAGRSSEPAASPAVCAHHRALFVVAKGRQPRLAGAG